MSKKKEDIRARSKVITFTAGEYEKLEKAFAGTTCRTLMEYLRKLILRKRITTYYRNKSFDEFVEEAILLRNEMRSIREKLPEDTQQIGRLIQLQEDIKLAINKLVDHACKNKTQ